MTHTWTTKTEVDSTPALADLYARVFELSLRTAVPIEGGAAEQSRCIDLAEAHAQRAVEYVRTGRVGK